MSARNKYIFHIHIHTSLSHQIIYSRCSIVDKRATSSLSYRFVFKKISDVFWKYFKVKSGQSNFNFFEVSSISASHMKLTVESSLSLSLYPSNSFDVIENVQFHKRNRHFVYTFSHFISRASNRFSHSSVCYRIDRSFDAGWCGGKFIWIFVISSWRVMSKLMNYGKCWGVFEWSIRRMARLLLIQGSAKMPAFMVLIKM